MSKLNMQNRLNKVILGTTSIILTRIKCLFAQKSKPYYMNFCETSCSNNPTQNITTELLDDTSWRVITSFFLFQVIIPDKTGSRVILKNVSRRDAGLYICTADNHVSQPVEKVTKITVKCKFLLFIYQMIDVWILRFFRNYNKQAQSLTTYNLVIFNKEKTFL